MRQLDTCDFCGDAADGVYEVVPASVAGESRRLALCTDCRATLQSVVDPLLDAAGSPPAAAPGAEDKSVTESAERTDDDSEIDAAESADSTAESDADDGIVIESGSADDQEATGTEGGDEADTGGTQSKRRPSGYAQVIRLLQNRDGTMPRDDLRALATNAYDLGGREFKEAVEAAVENGDLEESPAGLRTT
ncbi:hypothetical protein [Halobacterium noricense]|uniref:hypothetical protein n=1 Tax=Halobacterium noricense TaxID=223182 RepID=UPI001E4E057B|nr:hypothetical protein [Halobacterium noricense]UHH25138.1 hypothetical protein LT974_14310 [Halobacterium noricense]